MRHTKNGMRKHPPRDKTGRKLSNYCDPYAYGNPKPDETKTFDGVIVLLIVFLIAVLLHLLGF